MYLPVSKPPPHPPNLLLCTRSPRRVSIDSLSPSHFCIVPVVNIVLCSMMTLRHELKCFIHFFRRLLVVLLLAPPPAHRNPPVAMIAFFRSSVGTVNGSCPNKSPMRNIKTKGWIYKKSAETFSSSFFGAISGAKSQVPHLLACVINLKCEPKNIIGHWF